MLRSVSLLFVLLFSAASSSFAQSIDYLKHRKSFDICSIKRECTDCYSCNRERLKVKILNKADKKITAVFVKFYSPVFNKIVEKEVKIEGGTINPKETAILHVCVLNVAHWIFSRVVYDDQSETTFILHDRMDDFVQDADECDCND